MSISSGGEDMYRDQIRVWYCWIMWRHQWPRHKILVVFHMVCLPSRGGAPFRGEQYVNIAVGWKVYERASKGRKKGEKII